MKEVLGSIKMEDVTLRSKSELKWRKLLLLKKKAVYDVNRKGSEMYVDVRHGH